MVMTQYSFKARDKVFYGWPIIPLGGNSLRLVNRPLRTRMMGGVGAVGEKPAATRLDLFTCKNYIINCFGQVFNWLK